MAKNKKAGQYDVEGGSVKNPNKGSGFGNGRKGRSGGTYVVGAGDSWSSIAGEVFGNQRNFVDLMKANGGINLRPGMVIKLPGRVAKNPFVSNEVAMSAGMGSAAQVKAAYAMGGTGRDLFAGGKFAGAFDINGQPTGGYTTASNFAGMNPNANRAYAGMGDVQRAGYAPGTQGYQNQGAAAGTAQAALNNATIPGYGASVYAGANGIPDYTAAVGAGGKMRSPTKPAPTRRPGGDSYQPINFTTTGATNIKDANGNVVPRPSNKRGFTPSSTNASYPGGGVAGPTMWNPLKMPAAATPHEPMSGYQVNTTQEALMRARAARQPLPQTNHPQTSALDRAASNFFFGKEFSPDYTGQPQPGTPQQGNQGNMFAGAAGVQNQPQPGVPQGMATQGQPTPGQRDRARTAAMNTPVGFGETAGMYTPQGQPAGGQYQGGGLPSYTTPTPANAGPQYAPPVPRFGVPGQKGAVYPNTPAGVRDYEMDYQTVSVSSQLSNAAVAAKIGAPVQLPTMDSETLRRMAILSGETEEQVRNDLQTAFGYTYDKNTQTMTTPENIFANYGATNTASGPTAHVVNPDWVAQNARGYMTASGYFVPYNTFPVQQQEVTGGGGGGRRGGGGGGYEGGAEGRLDQWRFY